MMIPIQVKVFMRVSLIDAVSPIDSAWEQLSP